jgi:hypothetical protein
VIEREADQLAGNAAVKILCHDQKTVFSTCDCPCPRRPACKPRYEDDKDGSIPLM